MEILEHIPVSLDLDEVKRKLHMKKTGQEGEVQRLVEIAQPMIRAKAVYNVCYIEEKLEDAVNIDGTRLTSIVLRKNLDQVGRVFLYVVTVGNELEEKASACEDLLEQYYLDEIANVALRRAREYLIDQIKSRYAIDKMSTMNPGSLADWPIYEQEPLFSIIGDVEASIGVRLNETFLMIPRKSVSGIAFPAEATFISCQLCPRERCQSRKAPYDENKAKEYGILE